MITTAEIAGRALLAAIRGRLWFHRLSTPVLEQLRHSALKAAHGRKDEDPTGRAALRILRDVDSTLTRRARLDAEEADERTILELARTRTAPASGGTKVPLPPAGPRPLPPAMRQPEPEGAL